jgi:hypothetical protein
MKSRRVAVGFLVLITAFLSTREVALAQLPRGMKELPIVSGADSNFVREQIALFEKAFHTLKRDTTMPRPFGWQTYISPPNGVVFKLGAEANGYNHYLCPQFIGGDFDSVGDSVARNIATFRGPRYPIGDSGYQWTAMGSGVNGPVYEILGSPTNAFVGGRFDSAGGVAAKNIAYWDGTNWFPLVGSQGNGLDSTVLVITQIGDTILIGGNFTHAGGKVANHLAVWIPSAAVWIPFIDHNGENGVNGGVDAISVINGTIIIGGGFTNAGSTECRKIAAFSNGKWMAFDKGIDGQNSYVDAITDSYSYSSSFLVGGSFDSSNGTVIRNTGMWRLDSMKGFPMEEFGSSVEGVNGPVYDITIGRDGVAFAGAFDTAGRTLARNLATFDDSYDSGWFEYGGGLDAPGYSLAGWSIFVTAPFINNHFWVGGAFTNPGGILSPSLGLYLPEVRAVHATTPHPSISLFTSPNPFTDHAMLSYTLHHSSHVSLEIYDPIGRLVTKLIDKEVGAGKHTTEFKAGANAIPGVYLCKLVSGDGVALGKMVLVR